ncbi:UNVERIFIED_CONTAM: hypothetical protein Sradi_3278600 [Sesamum radiatum]|uniref:Uncharacterized protein n=1 Tax=Sesamum radiatum TaxID=300843 RepID=A0AAW2R0N3_SESRA
MGMLLVKGEDLALSGQGMPPMVCIPLLLLSLGVARSIRGMLLLIQFLMAWGKVTLSMGLITVRALFSYCNVVDAQLAREKLHPVISDYDVSKFFTSWMMVL